MKYQGIKAISQSEWGTEVDTAEQQRAELWAASTEKAEPTVLHNVSATHGGQCSWKWPSSDDSRVRNH